jgi:glucoamylase
VITGLICASELVCANGAPELGDFYAVFADWIESNLEKWTVTDDGVLLPEVRRHYMRIRPPAPSDRYYNPSVGEGRLQLSNRGPGEKSNFDAREVIDAGFLELVRYGIRSPHDPLIVDSLKVVDAMLQVNTPFGPCWRRYNHDGYGQKHDGGPYEGWGQGRAWPLLTGERAHYELAAGRDIQSLVRAIEKFSSEGGMLPEQIWDAPDLQEKGMFLGRPSGGAMPLAWAHAEYIKLLRSREDGEVFDRVGPVWSRYGGERQDLPVEICKRSHLLTKIGAGKTMRIVECSPFRVVWTQDDWITQQTTDSKYMGECVCYADIPIGRQAPADLVFTLYWPAEDQWEGRNYEVPIC